MQGNGLARPHQHFTAPKWDTIKISAIQSLRGWLSRWIHSALGLALSVIRVPGIYIIKPHEISHPCVVALKAAPSLFPMLPAFRLDAFSSFLPLVYPGYTNSLYSPLLPFKLERGPSRFEMSSVYGILSHALFFISRLFSLLLIISPSASLSLVNEIIPWPFWQWIIPNCAYYEDERESFIIPYSATTHRLWHPRCKSLEPFSIIYHISLFLFLPPSSVSQSQFLSLPLPSLQSFVTRYEISWASRHARQPDCALLRFLFVFLTYLNHTNCHISIIPMMGGHIFILYFWTCPFTIV